MLLCLPAGSEYILHYMPYILHADRGTSIEAQRELYKV